MHEDDAHKEIPPSFKNSTYQTYFTLIIEKKVCIFIIISQIFWNLKKYKMMNI